MADLILKERGFFWWHTDEIPNTHNFPEKHINGELEIDDEGRIKLKLDGVLFNSDKPPSINEILSPMNLEDKLIQGFLRVKDKNVLLHDIHLSNSYYSSSGVAHHEFEATNCVVQSEAFRQAGTIPSYKKIKIFMDGFEQWLALDQSIYHGVRIKLKVHIQCRRRSDLKLMKVYYR